MPSKAERKRRQQLVMVGVRQKQADAQARMPVSHAQLAALFDFLDEQLAVGCDNTTRFTELFLQQHRLPVQPVLDWLAEYGGYCDCEVLANVEEAWS